MKPKDYIGIILIFSAIILFYTFGNGLKTPTGYFAIDLNWTECGIDNETCLDDSLIDCDPVHFISGMIDQEIYVYPKNDSYCFVHAELTDMLLTDNETLTADCVYPKGNYTRDDFDLYLELYKYHVCNGSLIEKERETEGDRPISVEIHDPMDGESFLDDEDIELNATIDYNVTYDSGDYVFEYMIENDSDWKNASIQTYFDHMIFHEHIFIGVWKTSDLNITSDKNVTLRLKVNFTDNRSDIIEKQASVNVSLDFIPPPPSGGDMFEPDNSFTDPGDEAKEIIPGGGIQNRSFHSGDDVDYIYFDGQKDRMFTIRTEIGGSAVNTKISIFDSSKSLIGSDDDGGGSNESMMVYSLTSSGRVYIMVENLGSPGKYNISVTQLTDADGDGFSPGFGPEADCDDNDDQISPIRGGMVITKSLTFCPNTYSGLNSPVTVSGEGIVIDCDGNPVLGTMYSSFFVLNDSDDIELRNCDISNFTRAVVMDGCVSCVLKNLTVTGNMLGIHAINSILTLDDILASNNNHSGIILDDSDGSILSSDINNNQLDGVTLISSQGVIMDKVKISHNKRNGISLLSSDDIKVQDSEVSYNDHAGIMANNTDHLTILNSSISQNRDGILLSGSDGANITYSKFSSNQITEIDLTDDSEAAVLRFNSFLTQSNTALGNSQTPSVDARRNYWNTDSEDPIRERIFDYYDNATYGKVDYSPWLDSPLNLTSLKFGKNFTECDDGTDNDFDGLVDFGEDPQCPNSSWDNESIAPVIPVINDTDIAENDSKPIENDSCTGDWICTDWSPCKSDQIRVRTCINNNDCPNNPPKELEDCVYENVDLCSNGIRDMGEEMTDCGGICPNCSNDINPHSEQPKDSSSGNNFYIIIIFAVIVLAGGGYFGYRWYANEAREKEQMATYNKEKQLNDYIKDELLEGYAPEIISKKMSDAGWNKEMVSQSLARNRSLGQMKPFIMDYLMKGFSDDVITDKLVGAGWDRTIVTRVLDKLDRKQSTAAIPSQNLNVAWKSHYNNWNRQVQSKFSKLPPNPSMQTPHIGAYQRKRSRMNRPVKKTRYHLVMEDGNWVIKAE